MCQDAGKLQSGWAGVQLGCTCDVCWLLFVPLKNPELDGQEGMAITPVTLYNVYGAACSCLYRTP
jgi:hypothetical protein